MNYFFTIWCLLAVTASIEVDGGLGIGSLGLGNGLVYAPGHASADYYAYPRYAFEYAVKDPHTGDNKAQWEKRDGDVVKGAYSLVEPDGSLRVVEYWADDKSGFNAVVKRIGPNLHPTSVAAPIYKAPIPVLSAGSIAAPISIGPVAKYTGLASAPLISGPLGLGGAAISTASLIKEAPIAVAAPVAPVIRPAPYLGNLPWGNLPGPIISAPAPILKGPIGIPAHSLGDGLLKGSLGGMDHLGLGLGKIGYNNIGLGKVGYDNLGLGLLAKGGYGGYGPGLAKGGYGGYDLGLAKGGYDGYGLGLAKGGYDGYGLGLAKGGYDGYGLGLAKGGYDGYGLGLAKGGYDGYGLGLAKGGYDGYGLGLAKGGPMLPAVGGAWGGPLVGNLGWKH